MKKVSVIVPVYNAEKFLNECIQSILKQNYENYEIILVNDGSTDNSRAICENYAKVNECIKLFNKTNGGVSSARNLGLKYANGFYVMFVDSDDSINPNAIKLVMEFQKNYNSDLLIFNEHLKGVDSDKLEIDTIFEDGETFTHFVSYLLKQKRLNAIRNKVYKNDIIKKNKILFDEEVSLGEDTIFNYEYISFIESISTISNGLYNYRYDNNEKTLSKKFYYNKYEMISKQNDILNTLINNENRNFLSSYESMENIRASNLLSCMLDLYYYDNNLSVDEKKKYIKKISELEKNFNLSVLDSKYIRLFAKRFNNNNINPNFLRFLNIARSLKRGLYKFN